MVDHAGSHVTLPLRTVMCTRSGTYLPSERSRLSSTRMKNRGFGDAANRMADSFMTSLSRYRSEMSVDGLVLSRQRLIL